jgi:hypothetical protein
LLERAAADEVEEVSMAAEGKSQDDLQAHARSYALFVFVMKWGAIVSLIVTLLLIIIISA